MYSELINDTQYINSFVINNLLEQKHLIKNEKLCRVSYGLKKNENKADVDLTLSQKQQQQSEN